MQRRLEELKNTFGIHQLMNRNIYTLSSGERQMIALASAVTMNQKVLLFDEPSANLDYGNAMLLGKIIRKMKNIGYTIIVADHRFFYLNGIIDRVLFLDKGKLKLYDSEDEFKSCGYDTRSFDIFSLDIPCKDVINYGNVVAGLKNVSFKNILRNINLTFTKVR